MKIVLFATVLAMMLPEAVPEAVSVYDQVRHSLDDLGRSDEFPCAAYIFERESRWNPEAVGDRGWSWGLGQRNTKVWGMAPLPWSIPDQVIWFTWYADERYGGWCEAMEGWKHNRQVYGWGWW